MTTPTRKKRGGPEGRLHASHAQAAALAAGRTLPAREAIVATEPKVVATPADVLPDVDRRTIAVTVSGGAVGTVALIVGGPLAAMVAAGAPDADELLGVSTAALAEAVGGLEPYYPATLMTSPIRQIDLDAEPFDPGSVAVDLLDDGAHVATLVVDLVPAAAGVPAAEPYEPGAFTPVEEDRGSHPRRSLALLHDVEMAVTVELGRTRLSVRELLALAPGSVVELDRSAGSPVDVLVNGKLIARGEVVVIDEEFGIRISEIVGLQTVRS